MSPPRNRGSSHAPVPRPDLGATSGSGGTRDRELDFLRGVAIVFVVVNHITLPSAYRLVTVERIGPVTGAEIFVLLSGVVLGLVYRRRVERGWRVAIQALYRRAAKLYVASVAVVASVYVLGLLPGIDVGAVSSYVDERTGREYDLYPGQGLELVANVLTLEAGPAQFNVMGLYVVMLLVAPLLLWLLVRRHTLLLLALSWATYGLFKLFPATPLPAQSENAFPFLIWQLLVVHGVVVGFHRARILELMQTRAGRIVLATAAAGFGAFVFFAWNSPWAYVPEEARLRLIPEATYNSIYESLFERRTLDVGRLLALMCAVTVGYAALRRFRDRVQATAGRFFVPLGAATLYVFILHVYFVLAVAQFPSLETRGWIVATAVHTGALAVLWAMVRSRFLFGLIPR